MENSNNMPLITARRFEYGKTKLIKFIYNKNKGLNELFGSMQWVHFSYTYACYYILDDAILLDKTISYLENKAKFDIRNLNNNYKPIKSIPVNILSGKELNLALRADIKKKPSIKLISVIHNGLDIIGAQHEFNRDLYNEIQRIGIAVWNSEIHLWVIPKENEGVKRFVKKMLPCASISLHSSIKIQDSELLKMYFEQSQMFEPDFKSLS